MADILAASAQPDPKQKAATEPVAGLPADLVERMRVDTLAWQAVGGLLIGADASITPAPCSLLPYPWPAELFAQAQALAVPFNSMVDRIARDTDWLHNATRSVGATDQFTSRLLALSEAVHATGASQAWQLGIFRSDYMIHQRTPADAPRLVQVELNTISASFGSLSRKLSDMHAHLLPRWTTAPMCSSDAHTLRGWSPAIAGAIDSPGDKLPRNGCEEGIAGALAAAHAKYLEQTGGGGGAQGGGEVGCGGGEGGATLPAAVLMVVQPAERNVTDQRGIESCLWAKHKVPLVRMSMAEVAAHASLHGPTRRIRFTHRGFEASVVYFRAGYTPNDYPTEAEWQGREMLEMSFAIKCPSVGQHLAGTKKVQQLLSAPATLARFAPPADATFLQSCFAGLYGLDATGGPEVEEAVAMAVASPEGYVLKPQREGGGNNLFGQEMVEALRSMGKEERSAYILMERILPPTHPCLLMKGGAVSGGACAAELGVYGLFLGDGRTQALNVGAGHLLRAKMADVNEGGVVAGFAALSSPVLQ